MNNRIANILITQHNLSQIQEYIIDMDLIKDDPLKMCYVVSVYWLMKCPSSVLTERFGREMKFQHPNWRIDGIPATKAKEWFKIFSQVIGEENTNIFIQSVCQNYPNGEIPESDVSMKLTVPVNFPRTIVENPSLSEREKHFEQSFKVRDILHIMQFYYSTRYICHAICVLIANQGKTMEEIEDWFGSLDSQTDGYRQPYYNCADFFDQVATELSFQVIQQTQDEVNESVYSFQPNLDDYECTDGKIWLNGNEFSDFIERKLMLQNILDKNPEAEIHISLHVPLDFELALGQDIE